MNINVTVGRDSGEPKKKEPKNDVSRLRKTRDTRREQTDKANFRKRTKLPLNYATVDTVGDGHEKRPLTRHHKVTVDTREHNYASKKKRGKNRKRHTLTPVLGHSFEQRQEKREVVGGLGVSLSPALTKFDLNRHNSPGLK